MVLHSCLRSIFQAVRAAVQPAVKEATNSSLSKGLPAVTKAANLRTATRQLDQQYFTHGSDMFITQQLSSAIKQSYQPIVISFFHWDLHHCATCHWISPWDHLPFSYLYEPWALIVKG